MRKKQQSIKNSKAGNRETMENDTVSKNMINREKPNIPRSAQEHEVLEFSDTSLELSLKQGETAEGSFTVYAPEGTLAEGWIASSQMQMECLAEEFIGTKEEIPYRVHAEEMEPGDVLEGAFYIITNYGEYELPYRVEIESDEIASSMGNIKNMFHFANLAKENWEEAVKIFYSSQFRKLFTEGLDRQYYSAYKGLSAVPGNEQNMEEFLLEINKKQRVEFLSEKTEILVEDTEGVQRHEIVITRNGWGYTYLELEADGDFLRTEKKKVSEYDFLGNTFRLVFYIDSGKLHAGRNFGGIHIFNSYTDITIPVTVVCNEGKKNSYGIRKEKKQLIVQLVDSYCSFRGKKISSRIWLGETEKLVDRLSELDSKDIQVGLFKAQLLITQERFGEAKWQMERVKAVIDKEECPPAVWCYYLYLTTLYMEEDSYVDEIAERVSQIYKANQGSWRIAWLMLHLSEEYNRSPARRWGFLEEQFKRGCTSPAFYIEAWRLLEINPTFLTKMGDFELQILNFAVKRGFLSKDIIVQIRYQVQKMKGFSKRALFILKECYSKFHDDETLQAICTLLIKGNQTGSACFPWYSLGVEQELRITKLYEYYMMSLPEDYEGEIPKMVLMYFAYQSELDYKKNAFLYAYIYKRRKEHPEYYIKFCGQIENFVLYQLKMGRINKELAYLYKNLLTGNLMNEERAKQLVTLLFTHMISTENRKIRQIVVSYALSSREYKFPVSEGSAAVPLYGEDYKVLLEDGEGNRYTVSVPFRMERMMNQKKMLQMAMPFVKEHQGLDIYMCECNRSFMEIRDENVLQFSRIAVSSDIEPERKNEVCLKLIHYYFENDCLKELEDYLKGLEPEGMSRKERSEVIRFMVARGLYDKAFEWVKRFGIAGMDVKTLMRMSSRLISRDGFMEDRHMTYVIYHAFRKGKYDGNLISYLVYFYKGMLWQLREIWKAASAFEVDTYEICERILVQMMFSGSFAGERAEIFKEYVSGGAKPEVETSFLAQCSYDYFVAEKAIDPFFFTDIVRVQERGEKLHRVCRLAFLKYYAENKKEITPKIRGIAKRFLSNLADAGIYFAFFKEYVRELPAMERFADKTVIEYRTKPGSRVVIHYLIERGEYTEAEYQQAEMKDMYGGVYAKAFILFFGETLQYYITEELEGEKQFTGSASVNKGDGVYEEGDSRFELINAIAAAGVLQDYDTLYRLLEDYYKKEYIASRTFRLITD